VSRETIIIEQFRRFLTGIRIVVAQDAQNKPEKLELASPCPRRQCSPKVFDECVAQPRQEAEDHFGGKFEEAWQRKIPTLTSSSGVSVL
jgi:hypothetical protein